MHGTGWKLVAGAALIAGGWLIVREPWQHSYSGDGRFLDRGAGTGGARYELVLASMDGEKDATPRQLRFRVGPLPEPMNVYLVFPAQDGAGPAWPLDAGFRLRVVDAVTGSPCAQFEGSPRGVLNRRGEGIGAIVSSGTRDEWRLQVGGRCGKKDSWWAPRTSPLLVEFEWMQETGGAPGARLVELRMMGGFQWE